MKSLKLKFLAIALATVSVVLLSGCGVESKEAEVTEEFSAYFSSKEFYEEAFEDVSGALSEQEGNGVLGVVINHHLLAKEIIAEIFERVKNKNVARVVVLSPNHFSYGQGVIQTSLANWKTPYGILEADAKAIKKLDTISDENPSFGKEHGVSGLVGFIKKVFPEAEIVPIIIKDSFDLESSSKLAKELNKIINNETLVIASLDFSHYVIPAVAQYQDQLALNILNSSDFGSIKYINIDSKPALNVLLEIMKQNRTQKFNLVENTSASELLGRPFFNENTSYITGYFTNGRSQSNSISNFTFISDFKQDEALLDRYLNGASRLFLDLDLESFTKIPMVYKKNRAELWPEIVFAKNLAIYKNPASAQAFKCSESQKKIIFKTNQVQNSFTKNENCFEILVSATNPLNYGVTVSSVKSTKIGIQLLPSSLLTETQNVKLIEELIQNSKNAGTDLGTEFQKSFITYF